MDRRKRHGVQRPQTTALRGTRVASARLQSTLHPADRRIENWIGSGAQSTRTRRTWTSSCVRKPEVVTHRAQPLDHRTRVSRDQRGINKFAVYLLGRQFDVETDHAPLKWLGDHQHNARVARWALALQPFDLVVAHRRGQENVNADVLSRREDELYEATLKDSLWFSFNFRCSQ